MLALAGFMVWSFAACKTDDDTPPPSFTYPLRYQVVPAWTAPGENTIAVTVDSAGRAVTAGDSAKYLPVIYAERVGDYNNYLIYLGHIDNVPIGQSTTAAAYDGITSQTISLARDEISGAMVRNFVTTAVNLTTSSTTVNHSESEVLPFVSYKFFNLETKGKVENTIANSTIREQSISHTEHTALYKSSHTMETIAYTIGNNGEPAGRYRITLFATTDVYLSVRLEADNSAVFGLPEISVCARNSSYTYQLDYDPNISGDFGRTGGGGMLPIPDDFVVLPGHPRFVATGISGQMAYSDDGITWEQITTASSGVWNGIAYGNNKFVAVGGSGSTATSATSIDGVTWNLNNNTYPNISWDNVTFVNGRFVAAGTFTGSGIGGGGYTNVLSTNGGASWAAYSSHTTDCAYNGVDRWAATLGTEVIAHSTDFTGWANVTVGTEPWNSVAYGNSRFVAVGNAGNIAYSDNGTTWSQFSVGANDWNRVYYNGTLFVAAGAKDSSGDGKIAYSTNGANWTRVTVGTSTWSDVTYGEGVWVAVGGDAANKVGRIATSSDGITWTETNMGAMNSSYWNGITFGVYTSIPE